MFRKGLLVVISAPSGTGKGTLLKLLKERYNSVRLSISATTRKPRECEIDGQNYFFRTIDEFKNMIAHNELLEWDEYCNNFYGTPIHFVQETLELGFDVVLEITVKGAVNIIDKYPDALTIFILPPSFEELHERITGRGTEMPDVINKRLEQAKWEMTFIDKYDYIVVNDNVENAVDKIISILVAEKLKFKRNREIFKNIDMQNWRFE